MALELKKNQYFILIFCGIVLVLGIVRCARPSIADDVKKTAQTAVPDTAATAKAEEATTDSTQTSEESSSEEAENSSVAIGGPAPSQLGGQRNIIDVKAAKFFDKQGKEVKHKVFSVPSYEECFPDINMSQLTAAQKWGVRPVNNREEAEHRMQDLVFVGSCPYYHVDRLRSSIPYLVPRASNLLRRISRNFLDSLAIKQIPLHTLIISSIMRTQEDVQKLQQHNGNASSQSCHCYGTTFDICYNRYNTVEDPAGPHRRVVRNDTLKWILSEVLRDAREAGLCYVKHERHQGCFHVTVR